MAQHYHAVMRPQNAVPQEGCYATTTGLADNPRVETRGSSRLLGPGLQVADSEGLGSVAEVIETCYFAHEIGLGIPAPKRFVPPISS